MARNLIVGETVYIPKKRLGIASDEGSALKDCTVVAVEDRSISVDVNDGDGNALRVAASAAHRNINVLVLRLGDFVTEASFLDPLTKSILQYLRVLLTDGFVTRIEVRSLEELRLFWRNNHGTYSHVVLVGHGEPDGFTFAVNDLVRSEDFVAAFDVPGAAPKVFLSLACQTGKGRMAKLFSANRICAGYLGPYESVHGADASLFVQTFLNKHFLDGVTLRVATKQTYDALSRCVFRLWQNGRLEVGFHVR